GWCGYLSFFSLYQPDSMVQLVRNHSDAGWQIFSGYEVAGWDFWLGPLGMSGLLIAMAASFLVIGALRFSRRDLPSPM
ncbi:MAG: hypothetical protein AAF483_26305, partial [Planctomycetota bacterium]